MIYRPIANTGMSASVIGLGMEHLDNKPCQTVDEVINTALDHGINMMDLFMPGDEVRKNIGKALAGKRDKALIQGHIGSTDIKQQYDISRDRKTIQTYFEKLLRHLNTDYIDFGMLFFIDTEKHFSDVFNGDVLAYALDLKQKGHIRAIGASSHNPLIARKIIETDLVDLLLFSLNPAFDMIPAETSVLDYLDKAKHIDIKTKLDPARAELYKLCEQKGKSITVMKSLAAGKLISKEHTPFARALSVTQCIHYALTRPAVASVLLGCASKQEVMESVSYLNAAEEEKDYSVVIKEYANSIKGSCMYCNHCLPCPAGIDIASVTKFLDIALLDKNNLPVSIVNHYRGLEHTAAECTACGSCEKRCPFSVPVISNMKKAVEVFA